ncbi:toll-like receptor Tollo [Oratosquilla oratoria]|uniref:toll-like receptor Tollo n=1 Tax=Oratosquilla oratoria TaxID=337810 RepID=UPI003F775B32
MRCHPWLWCFVALSWALPGIWCRDYQTPEDCHVTSVVGTDLMSLRCRLRTINSEIDATNFSVIPTRNTVRLRIECSDVLFFQSALQNKSFVRLVELQELDIEYCKIGEVPREAFFGLHSLRNLTLRTYNTDWSAMTLTIAKDAFRDQKRLERLDLGDNNIWTLPRGVFCDMENLRILNLSRNKLQEVSDLSFTNSDQICAQGLRQLDLSYNHLVSVTAFGFAALKNLQRLNMSLNGISKLEDKALFGMYSLEVLDLSGNLLTALPPELFQENKRLTKLYLKNNSISVLAPGLFSGLDMLLELDLSNNELTNTWVNSETFTDLIRLAILDLSYNKIVRLDAATFRDLTNLQALNLHQNQIEIISDNTFSELFRLHTLVLSSNRLSTIGAFTFSGLVGLHVLHLDDNMIYDINENALQNSTQLQELYLSENEVKEVPKVVQTLAYLKTLDITANHITDIRNAPFRHLQHLSNLKLSSNIITNINKEIFSNLTNLQILNLESNEIHDVESSAFDKNVNLQAIRLDDNHLTNVVGLFADLPNLIWLNLSKNHLEVFDYAFIPKGLEYLDLRSNNISELGNYYEIESQLSLRVFDASYNRLMDISASSVPDSVEILLLNNNLITRVQAYAFFKKNNLTRVDLFANQISNIDQNALRISAVEVNRDLPEFYLGGNPFQCDCTMGWLQSINSLEVTRQHPSVIDLDSIYCRLLNNRAQSIIPLLEAKKSQFLCEYESHCFALCHCCDFDACDCEMTCPTNCTCFHDESWVANIVDCSVSEYEVMPERIPMDSTEVYLDGNNFRDLSSHTFIGRKNLRVLFLNNSNIEIIHNRTFNGLKQLHVLHLENNVIRVLKGYELEQLSSLRELYLHNNKLMTIHNSTFATLTSLEILRLDGNLLTVFPVWYLGMNQYLVSVQLRDNPWSCECDYLEEMRTWVQTVGKKLVDLEEMVCVHNETGEEGPRVSAFNISTCTNFTATTIIKHEVLEDYVFLPTITLSAFALLLLVTLLIFCNRNRMRVWLYAKYGVRLFYKSEYEGDRDKLFDAFVSYSSKDEVFVTQILAPELERGNPAYKLCLYYRDFPVGAYIADTIVSAVESSKRTIIILSENFIKSEWCRFELRSAHHQVLKDRRRRLIVILLGDVPQRDLDPDIRLYLKTNTYLKWGDTQFWEKLKFAMPDARPPSRSHHLHTLGSQPPVPRPVAVHI